MGSLARNRLAWLGSGGGVGRVIVPDSYTFVEARYDGYPGGEVVTGSLTTSTDRACEVSSSYTGMADPTLGLPIEEVLQNDAVATTWERSDDARHWATDGTTSDRFEVTCDDPAVARRIAETSSFGARGP